MASRIASGSVARHRRSSGLAFLMTKRPLMVSPSVLMSLTIMSSSRKARTGSSVGTVVAGVRSTVRGFGAAVAGSASSLTCRTTSCCFAGDSMPSYVHGHSALFRASSRRSGGKGLLTGGDADPGHGSAHLLVRRTAPGFPGFATGRTGPWRPRGRNDGHAAASTDEHVAHDADRFASTRARRTAAARDVRSAGTVSPVPKYISSGVCPRNAECGSTRLCSST
jgi:hypothetical protein